MSKDVMVLKRDGGGRVLVPLDRQVELVREFERSGLSGPRFAALAGLKNQTFAAWRRKHGQLPPARRGAVGRPRRGAWVEAVAEPGRGGALLVRLGGGACMEVSDAAQAALAARVIQALQRPC